MKYSVTEIKDGDRKDFVRAKDLVEQCEDLNELTNIWVQHLEGRVTFVAAFDDDEKRTMVAIILSAHQKECAEFYMPISEVLTAYGPIQAVDSYVQGARPDRYGLDVDEEGFDRRDESIGAVYNDDLCERLMPRTKLLNLCLSYAISNIGEASVELVSEESREEWGLQETSLSPVKLAVVHAGYREPKTGIGFGEALYVAW